MLLGINIIGVDVSPLCILQSRVKTESIEVLDRIEEIKNEIVKASNESKITLIASDK